MHYLLTCSKGLSTGAHHLHAYAGKYIAYDVVVHVTFPMLRWFNQGNGLLLFTSRAGITGLIATIVLPLIACLMFYEPLKKGYYMIFVENSTTYFSSLQ